MKFLRVGGGEMPDKLRKDLFPEELPGCWAAAPEPELGDVERFKGDVGQ
jgi:hypothetical protein